MPIQITTKEYIKIQNQTVSNGTQTADTDLKLQLLQNAAYLIEGTIAVSLAGVLPIYTWTFTGPASPVSVIIKSELMVAGATVLNLSNQTSYGTVNSSPSITGGLAILKFSAVIANGPNTGNFAFNFAVGGTGTSVTNLSGSYMRSSYGVFVSEE